MKVYVSLPWSKKDDESKLKELEKVKKVLEFHYKYDIDLCYASKYDNRESLKTFDECMGYIKDCDKILFLVSPNDSESPLSKIEFDIATYFFLNKIISLCDYKEYLREYDEYHTPVSMKTDALEKIIKVNNASIPCFVKIGNNEYPVDHAACIYDDILKMIIVAKNKEKRSK